MNTLLRTEALDLGHGDRTLVRGVHMRVAAGELVALIGVNGCGKSTLLRTLAGLHPPLGGVVLLDGRPLRTLSAVERARHMAMVLTARPQVGLLDVRTLVSLGRQPWTGHMGRLSEADERHVVEAMDRTEVAHLQRRSVDMLSDGERQKVMIARALAQDAPLLLLDEPTAFLDLVNRVRVMHLLRDIAHGMGKGVLLSTHDLRTALDLADRILLVHEGKAWSGTPQEAVTGAVLGRAFSGGGLEFDAATGTLR